MENRFKDLKSRMQNDPQLVQKELEDLLSVLQAENDTDNQFTCYLLLADVQTHLGKLENARNTLNIAAAIPEATNNKRQLAKLHNSLGVISWYQGNYSEALEEYMLLKQFADELKDDRLLFNAYNNIGMIYWIEDDYQGAIDTYTKGLELLTDKNSHDAANAFNNIGICYLRMRNFELALVYLNKGLNIFVKENDQKLIANSYINIANCHLDNNDRSQAIAFTENALKIKRKINDRWGICHCLSSTAKLYLADDRLPEAWQALEEALPLSLEIGAKDLARECYFLTSDYYEKTGDFQNALNNYKEFTQLQHEITQTNTQKQIAEMQKNFELIEKEKENEIFRLTNIELKKKNELISRQKKRLDDTLKELKRLNKNLQKEIDKQIELLRHKDQMISLQSKQAAMGEMLACIAHQWKQPLTGISMITQNLQDAWEYEEFSEEFLYRNCHSILDLVKFMSNTINDFRDFFRPELEANDFDLKDVVQKTLRFVEHSLKQSNINIELDMEEISVHGFPNYYSQVVMNILNNARDALEEKKVAAPLIRIKTFQSPVNKKSVLTIEDNAGGIDPANLKKIFNAYFSTKSREKGTGLGLYMSKLIIEKNMHGKLSVKNTSTGACFRIEI
ncbi:MAG: tetratricopeptide repeat-containing sensor histidine kinase [Candidatus Cloacimonetes bacterium]|nr:tetratricopeptide repeat-containing sensor histidine kinase [Candidatus Cloacimonadota bacterium]